MNLTESEMKKIEKKLYHQGFSTIAGVDEAGCGPLAGPVVACAIVLPKDYFNPQIYDSKKLTPELREKLFGEILNVAIDVGIGIADNREIDKLNIRRATKLAMKRAILDLEIKPDAVLVDGNFFDLNLPELNYEREVEVINIVKGDRKSISIASASIIAKVFRDEIMNYYDKIFPEYKFSKNKGYPTTEHIEAIKKFGITKIHRRTYKPIPELLQLRLFKDDERQRQNRRRNCG